MGRFWHVLEPNKTRVFPRNWLWFDTETNEIAEEDDRHYQTLRLGVACYNRDRSGRNKARSVWWDFTDVAGFWEQALKICESDRRLIIMGFNVGFDFRIVDGFRWLTDHGYTPDRLYMGQFCVLLTFRRGKHTIMVLDAMNWFRGSLDSWGKLLKLPKIDVDFAAVSDADLLAHCRRDVEIMREVWLRWRQCVQENDLGHFCPTLASQALTFFRHNCMRESIVIPADVESCWIERASYHGGRVECFHLGWCPGGPFHKLDVNSMYSAVMEHLEVPVKFLRVLESVKPSELPALQRRYALIGDVDISTDVPAYPYWTDGKLAFPIGDFQATLAGPELVLAVKYGHVKSVGRLAVYRKAVIFDKYVRRLHDLKIGYERDGNLVFREMIKRMANSLYGKFGQVNPVRKYMGHDSAWRDGTYHVIELGQSRPVMYLVVCGHGWRESGREEALHAFPAIASYVSSAARVYLWYLMNLAGRENVLYVDTDSLFVNDEGRDRLSGMMHPHDLGKLKTELDVLCLQIFAPKDYQAGDEIKLKGVPKSAKQLSMNRWEYWEWEGLRGAVHNRHLDRVYMYYRVKVLERMYDKGFVHSSGSVSPRVILASSAASRRLVAAS